MAKEGERDIFIPARGFKKPSSAPFFFYSDLLSRFSPIAFFAERTEKTVETIERGEAKDNEQLTREILGAKAVSKREDPKLLYLMKFAPLPLMSMCSLFPVL